METAGEITLSPSITACFKVILLVGAGVIIRDGIEITENVTIGMGSVVVRSIVEPGVYLGNPCRKIR